MSDDESLQAVFFVDGTQSTVGETAEWIELRADGYGLSGCYHRIHVKYKDGTLRTYPAHHCLGWEKSDA